MMFSFHKLKIERAQAKSKVTRIVNILEPLLDKKEPVTYTSRLLIKQQN